MVDGSVPARYFCPFLYKTTYDVVIVPLPALYGHATALENHQQRVSVSLQEA